MATKKAATKKKATTKKKTTSSSSKGKSKVHKVMKEHKEGKLKSGSGKKVTSRKQAVLRRNQADGETVEVEATPCVRA
jgi:hypothetical protein